jgi:hypothetical protein
VAVSFISKVETSLTGSVNDLTGLTYPTGAAAGDVLLGIWGSDATQTATLDAAMTSLAALADGSAKAIAFTKKSTGAESGSVSMNSAPTANRQAAAFARYRGSRRVNASNVQAASESGTDTTHTSPTITPTEDGVGIVLLYVERVTSTTLPIQEPQGTGFTLRASFSTGGTGGVAVAIADKLTGNLSGVQITPGDWTGTTAAGAVEMYAVELLPNVQGVLAASFGVTAAEVGTRQVLGTLAASTGVVAAMTGTRTVLGHLAAVTGISAALTGTRKVFGTLAASSGVVAALTGKRTVKGTAAASFGVTSAMSGDVSGPSVGIPGNLHGQDAALPGAVVEETFDIGGTIR